jgi:hypothetical protein
MLSLIAAIHAFAGEKGGEGGEWGLKSGRKKKSAGGDLETNGKVQRRRLKVKR